MTEEKKGNQNADNDYNQEYLTYDATKINVVSLFAGAGGLDLGVELAGLDAVIGEETTNEVYLEKETFEEVRFESIFHTVYANDILREALETYENNFPKSVYIHHEDICRIKEVPPANMVLGGFPSLSFSAASSRFQLVSENERYLPYSRYIKCLIQAQPEVFIAENVKGILSLGRGEVIKQIKNDFEAAGYKLYYKLINACDYGIPQMRERVFFVGVRQDIDFEYIFPSPTHGENAGLLPYVTLREAIKDLESNPGPYYTGSFTRLDMSRNRKKSWDEQSYAILPSARQTPLHPSGLPMVKLGRGEWVLQEGKDKNRRLSIKEIMRIQTFPDWFEFEQLNSSRLVSNSELNKIYRQIGNAVPVELARTIARPIAEWAVARLEDTNIEVD